MGSTTEFDQTAWYWWQGTVHFILCFIITFVLTLSHGIYMYQDLRTTQRKSVSQRQSQPAITKSYTAVLLTVFISFLSYTILSIGAIFHFFVTEFLIDGDAKCALLTKANPLAYQTAKGSMYLVFLGRIHTVYAQSAYGYKPSFLFIIALIVIVMTSTVYVLFILFNEHNYRRYSFGTYAMHCNPNYANFVVMIIAVFDFIMCTFSAIAFIKPLVRVYKHRSKSTTNVNAMVKYQKLIDIGQKYMILTCTAVISTVLLMVWIAATDTVLLTPYDVVINCVSMALMTPYYEDIMYQRLCCCCIKCVGCCLRNTKDLKTQNQQQMTMGVPLKTHKITKDSETGSNNEEV